MGAHYWKTDFPTYFLNSAHFWRTYTISRAHIAKNITHGAHEEKLDAHYIIWLSCGHGTPQLEQGPRITARLISSLADTWVTLHRPEDNVWDQDNQDQYGAVGGHHVPLGDNQGLYVLVGDNREHSAYREDQHEPPSVGSFVIAGSFSGALGEYNLLGE